MTIVASISNNYSCFREAPYLPHPARTITSGTQFDVYGFAPSLKSLESWTELWLALQQNKTEGQKTSQDSKEGLLLRRIVRESVNQPEISGLGRRPAARATRATRDRSIVHRLQQVDAGCDSQSCRRPGKPCHFFHMSSQSLATGKRGLHRITLNIFLLGRQGN